MNVCDLIDNVPDVDDSQAVSDWFVKVRDFAKVHGLSEIYACADKAFGLSYNQLRRVEYRTKLLSLLKSVDLEADSVMRSLKEYDVFVSYAKVDSRFVNRLYSALDKLRISIFRDKESIGWGDDWRQCIERGLTYCEFGIVVLSDNFLGRDWPEKEVDTLLSRQNASGDKLILPLVLGSSVKDICNRYPKLEHLQMLSAEDVSVKDIALGFAAILIKRYKQCLRDGDV